MFILVSKIRRNTKRKEKFAMALADRNSIKLLSPFWRRFWLIVERWDEKNIKGGWWGEWKTRRRRRRARRGEEQTLKTRPLSFLSFVCEMIYVEASSSFCLWRLSLFSSFFWKGFHLYVSMWLCWCDGLFGFIGFLLSFSLPFFFCLSVRLFVLLLQPESIYFPVGLTVFPSMSL